MTKENKNIMKGTTLGLSQQNNKLTAKIELAVKCPSEPVLTIEEAAYYCSVAYGTFKNWVAMGKVKADRLNDKPRFSVESLRLLYRRSA